MKQLKPSSRLKRPFSLVAPKPSHPFVFFPTLESLKTVWDQAAQTLANSSFEQEVPIDRAAPYGLIRQARTVWPILKDKRNLWALLRGDIMNESFLATPEGMEIKGSVNPIGFVLTLHRYLDRKVFKPTVCETLARLTLAAEPLRHAAGDQALVAFDFATPGPHLRDMMQGICQSQKGPFLAFHEVGGLPVHMSVAQLYAGKLPKRLAEIPVYCDNKRYEAYRRMTLRLPDPKSRVFPDKPSAAAGAAPSLGSVASR